MSGGSYHHGNLRRAVIDAAVEAISESGPATWSLRELARRAGVSHAAPAHHFGDRAGVLTAVAAEGYGLFADALEAAGDRLDEVGLAYVRFAVEHRPYFEVIFRPELYRPDDPDVRAARERAGRVLAAGVRGVTAGGPEEGDRTDSIAAWSIVHGFAHLWLSGALPADLGDDPVAAARPVIRRLFGR
ncbi:TetR/AcrR family transcriptional regulator [Actinomadura sp. GC306]|uniref:TetR/AcrR family transcriptional regulator n=1 Tax=Actinomadura sp. GC306 TaxID=2530367 RepID=UPI00104B4219|nr:TetR-like C-terminal domain-containing protein [Actinomadura sp. GC306]TDC67040.1 TetR/AcrR family transcriptional regulator [Actinomadura sp. GC306]